MQEEAVPCKLSGEATAAAIEKAVAERAVTVVARRGCCMGHVASGLLVSMGVNPAMYEVDKAEETSVAKQLRAAQLPAVFIGGNLVGGLDKIMTTHLNGQLTPLLKQAGALWL